MSDQAAGDNASGALLLPYQQHLIRTTAIHQVTVVEKSRRIGATWAVAADAVLTAAAAKPAGGMDVFYIGYNLDMAREFVDTCAAWARLFHKAALATGAGVDRRLFVDAEPGRAIGAFRIALASGFEIAALASRPRSLRGRQGYVIVDEAAFHDDLAELMKAALALLVWGGKVLVISTHDGGDNPFNRLVDDTRAGRTPYALLRIDFDEALADGLFRRICRMTGRDWSAVAEAAWRQGIVDFYGEAAREELFCEPRQGGGAYLGRALIEGCMEPDIPVLRLAMPDGFAMEPEPVRMAEIDAWCRLRLDPLLARLPEHGTSFLGQDFGRSGDLTVLWPFLLGPDLIRRTPFVIELRNMPFRQQEQILFHLADRLPGLVRAGLDAGGNGAALAEFAVQRYGAKIHAIRFTVDWYREHMPRFKAAFEDRTLRIPRDADILEDLRSIAIEHGVAKVPAAARRIGADGGRRHGDAAIAAVLAFTASLSEAVPIEFSSTARPAIPHGFGDFLASGGGHADFLGPG